MARGLQIVSPCHESWDAMEPTEHGRFCAQCQREVLDLTRVPDAEAAALLASDDHACVRATFDRGCPTERAALASIAALGAVVAATTGLAGCAPARSAAEWREHPDLSPWSSCPGWAEPRVVAAAPEAAPSDIEVEDICRIVPDAPQCRFVAEPRQHYSTVDGELPVHATPQCDWSATRALVMGQVPARPFATAPPPPRSDWPSGPDVVVVGVAADGVAPESVQRAALRMLPPLQRCYEEGLRATAGGPAYGRLLLSARVAEDGTIAHVDIDGSADLPAALTRCAVALLRAERVDAPHEDLASLEIDLRFVHRVGG